jgi:hypothetical protein
LWTKHSLDCLAGSSEWHVPPLCLCEKIFWIPSSEVGALLYRRMWMPCSASSRALETILLSIVSCPVPPGCSWCRILLRPAQSFPGGPAGHLHLANWHACPRLVPQAPLELSMAASLAPSADLSSLDLLSLSTSFNSCFCSFRVSGSSLYFLPETASSSWTSPCPLPA